AHLPRQHQRIPGNARFRAGAARADAPARALRRWRHRGRGGRRCPLQRLPPQSFRAGLGSSSRWSDSMNKPVSDIRAQGEEHWTQKGDARLFLWEKRSADGGKAGTVLFVHGSSMASQPTFDLQVPGRAGSSVMDWFTARGFDTWSVDMEGYGRSTKDRDNNAPISQGADDCHAAATYIHKLRGKRPLLVYGISSGAL